MVYFIILFILKGINKDEFKFMRELFCDPMIPNFLKKFFIPYFLGKQIQIP